MSTPDAATPPGASGAPRASTAADAHPRIYRRLTPSARAALPPWDEERFGDPTVPAGRPRSLWLYGIVIALAGLADFGQFYQIVQVVMRDLDAVTSFGIVLGITVAVIALAHMAGVILREVRARQAGDVPDERGPADSGRRWTVLTASWVARRPTACLCLLLWAAFGVVAFWVRLDGQAATTGGDAALGFDAPQVTGQGDAHLVKGAALFLMLYLVTGAVATIGGYRTHDPVRSAYFSGVRARRRAVKRLAALRYKLDQAEAEHRALKRELELAKEVFAERDRARAAFAEYLKQVSRLLIAQRAGDPAVTDAILLPDQRPYNWRSVNGHRPPSRPDLVEAD